MSLVREPGYAKKPVLIGQIQLGLQFRTPHAAFRNQHLTGTCKREFNAKTPW
jgi:hypothetical protein